MLYRTKVELVQKKTKEIGRSRRNLVLCLGVDILCSRAPVLLLFKNIQNHIFGVFKKLKKNPDAAHELSHRRAKYQFQILYSLSCTKITKV
jgi:hypothetical protein